MFIKSVYSFKSMMRFNSLLRGSMRPHVKNQRGLKSKIDLPLCKIVATIGPASENLPMLPAVVDAGMRIMRINFSHATYDEADLRMTNLKKSPGIHGTDFNLRAVMLDTQGPEVRTGIYKSDKGEYNIGDEVTITTDPKLREHQSKDLIWISYSNLNKGQHI